MHHGRFGGLDRRHWSRAAHHVSRDITLGRSCRLTPARSRYDNVRHERDDDGAHPSSSLVELSRRFASTRCRPGRRLRRDEPRQLGILGQDITSVLSGWLRHSLDRHHWHLNMHRNIRKHRRPGNHLGHKFVSTGRGSPRPQPLYLRRPSRALAFFAMSWPTQKPREATPQLLCFPICRVMEEAGHTKLPGAVVS